MRKPIEQCYQEFKLKNKLNNLSKATIVFYDECFKKFLPFAKKHKKRFMHELTEDFIKCYQLKLINSPISDHSKNTYIRGIKAFIRYAQDQKLVKEYKISLIKCSETIKPTFTLDELRKLSTRPAAPERDRSDILIENGKE